MKYALLIYGNEQASFTEAESAAEYEAYNQFTKDIVDRGLMQSGEALQPTSTATTVQVRGGETLTTDGPFAEVKEFLAGFFLIECNTRERAIEIAARVPEADFGRVEVRPVMDLKSWEM